MKHLDCVWSVISSLAVCGPSAPTQSAQAVGWVDTQSAQAQVEVQGIDSQCLPARVVCRSLAGGVAFYAGGTAYDPRHRTAWVSDGTVIEEVRLADCAATCRMTAMLMDPTAVVSGLAMRDARRQLVQLETRPGYLGLRSYDATPCPPVPLRDGCTMTLAPGAVAAGLAYDEVRGLLYFTVSTPNAIDWTTDLFVAADTARCQPLCSVRLPRCGPFYPRSGVITGLAHDSCTDQFWATNGLHTQVLRLVDPATCRIAIGACCARQTPGEFRGLDLVPASVRADVGRSCADPVCVQCPGARLALIGGDASLGNQDFGLRIHSAAVGSIVVPILGGGACTGGVQPPFLCGPIHFALTPAPILLPAAGLGGPFPSCLGTADCRLPIPADPALCGVMLCAQWFLLCGPGFRGSGISQAVEFRVEGS